MCITTTLSPDLYNDGQTRMYKYSECKNINVKMWLKFTQNLYLGQNRCSKRYYEKYKIPILSQISFFQMF